MAELSVAASRRLQLQQRADAGDARAAQVLAVQAQPGDYFTVVQIGVNTIAILRASWARGADAALRCRDCLGAGARDGGTRRFLRPLFATVVTALFVVLADLVPKRLSMNRARARGRGLDRTHAAAVPRAAAIGLAVPAR